MSLVFALGSVTVSVTGAEVLKATQAPGVYSVSTATGVNLYVLMAVVLFSLSVVPAIALTRGRRPAPPPGSESRPGPQISSRATDYMP